MFYVSIKGGVCVCVCVYTWDRGFLVYHWAVGALLGGGLLEAEPDVSVGCV